MFDDEALMASVDDEDVAIGEQARARARAGAGRGGA